MMNQDSNREGRLPLPRYQYSPNQTPLRPTDTSRPMAVQPNRGQRRIPMEANFQTPPPSFFSTPPASGFGGDGAGQSFSTMPGPYNQRPWMPAVPYFAATNAWVQPQPFLPMFDPSIPPPPYASTDPFRQVAWLPSPPMDVMGPFVDQTGWTSTPSYPQQRREANSFFQIAWLPSWHRLAPDDYLLSPHGHQTPGQRGTLQARRNHQLGRPSRGVIATRTNRFTNANNTRLPPSPPPPGVHPLEIRGGRRYTPMIDIESDDERRGELQVVGLIVSLRDFHDIRGGDSDDEGDDDLFEMMLGDEVNGQQRGLSIDQINRLPIVEITPDQVADTINDKPSCAVCLEEMAVGERVVKLNCTHLFHHPCIEPWLLRRTTCPTCRGPVEVIGGEEATGGIDG